MLGTAALLLAGFMVFQLGVHARATRRCSATCRPRTPRRSSSSSTPTACPTSSPTAATRSWCPQDQVYRPGSALSGEGLPGSSGDTGYSLLDEQGITTSRVHASRPTTSGRMEGELANTIEAIDGVEAAIVHLAMPEKEVFADEQDPTTASVLVGTAPGRRRSAPEQVQAIVHLVASSVDGLDPEQGHRGRRQTARCSRPPTATGGRRRAAAARQQIDDVPEAAARRGPDHARPRRRPRQRHGPRSPPTSTSTRPSPRPPTYSVDPERAAAVSRAPAPRPTTAPAAAAGGVGGVVGTDGQMDGATTGDATAPAYEKSSADPQQRASTAVVEHRESAPGVVESLHVAVVLDTRPPPATSTRPSSRAWSPRPSASTRTAATPSRSRTHAVRPHGRGRRRRRSSQAAAAAEQERRADGPDPQDRAGVCSSLHAAPARLAQGPPPDQGAQGGHDVRRRAAARRRRRPVAAARAVRPRGVARDHGAASAPSSDGPSEHARRARRPGRAPARGRRRPAARLAGGAA